MPLEGPVGGVSPELGVDWSTGNLGLPIWQRIELCGSGLTACVLHIPGSRRYLPKEWFGVTCLLTASYDPKLRPGRISVVLASDMLNTLHLYLRGCRSCNRFFSTGSMTGVDRDVLISRRLQGGGTRWLNDVDTGLRPTGLRVYPVHTRAETICRVEHGGLAGAVIIADGRQIEGLSLLRTIRSIDRDLPCWLVTDDARRATLEAALALRVMSVFTHPVRVEDLTLALTKLLVN